MKANELYLPVVQFVYYYFANWFLRNFIVLILVFWLFLLVGHAPQYFPSESNQLLLPGPSALDNISMSTASLAPHSHHTPAGPHQLHPGLTPFMSNSSYSTSSRTSLDMDLAHKENDRTKCIQAPGISLHPTWNTLGQAWSFFCMRQVFLSSNSLMLEAQLSG